MTVKSPITKRMLVVLGAALALLVAPAGPASAAPSNSRASCVGVITSYEGSQLAPGSVGHEVSGLATQGPGFGTALVSPLAHEHLGSLESCRQAEE
jgi:hypothetical protein